MNASCSPASYGGYMARGIIHRMADRVNGLLLLCPAIIMDSAKRNVPSHVILERDGELLSGLTPSDADSSPRCR